MRKLIPLLLGALIPASCQACTQLSCNYDLNTQSGTYCYSACLESNSGDGADCATNVQYASSLGMNCGISCCYGSGGGGGGGGTGPAPSPTPPPSLSAFQWTDNAEAGAEQGMESAINEAAGGSSVSAIPNVFPDVISFQKGFEWDVTYDKDPTTGERLPDGFVLNLYVGTPFVKGTIYTIKNDLSEVFSSYSSPPIAMYGIFGEDTNYNLYYHLGLYFQYKSYDRRRLEDPIPRRELANSTNATATSSPTASANYTTRGSVKLSNNVLNISCNGMISSLTFIKTISSDSVYQSKLGMSHIYINTGSPTIHTDAPTFAGSPPLHHAPVHLLLVIAASTLVMMFG